MPTFKNENGFLLQTEDTTFSANSTSAATYLNTAVKLPILTKSPGTAITEEHFTSLGLAYDISDNTVKSLQMNADGKLLCDVGNLTLNTGSLTVDNSGVETGLSTVNTTLQGNLKIINGTNGSGDIPLTVTDSSLTGALNVTPLVASDNFTRNAIFASDPSTGRARIVECDNSGKLQVGGSVTATLSTTDNNAIDAITTAVSVGNVGDGPDCVFNPISPHLAHKKTVIVGVDINKQGTPIKVDTDGKLIIKSDPQYATHVKTEANKVIDRTVMVGHYPDDGRGIPLKVDDTGILQIEGTTVIYGQDSVTPTTLRALKTDSSGNLQVNTATDVTVNGTVTANLSTTDNAVLDSINVSVGAGVDTGIIPSTATSIVGKIAGHVSHQRSVMIGVDNSDTAAPEGVPLSVDGSGVLNVATDFTSGNASELTESKQVAVYGQRNGGGAVRMLELDGSGNLKVSIEGGATPAITGFNLESTQTDMSAKISKGAEAEIDAATGAQQVLIYGIDGNDNLRGVQVDNSGRIKTNTNEGTISSTTSIHTTFARTAMFISDGIVARVASCDTAGKLFVANSPIYSTSSTLFSAITEAHSQSYDNNTQGFTNTIVTAEFTKISVVGKITNTFPDELSNVLRVELWPVFSSSPSEDDAANMIGPVASGLFIKDYLYFDTVELLYPSVKLRVVNEGIDDAVLNLRVYMRK
jgi:hypothetical protein